MNKAFLALLTTLFLFCSCQSTDTDSVLEKNKAVVLEYHKVWSNGKISLLDTIISPDFVCHFIGGLEWEGIEGAKNSITNHKKSFPDWTEEIVDIIAEGDKVVTRYKSTGTHQGIFNGVDSTGNKVIIYETSIYRLANGKIIEQWGFPDEVSLRNQLQTKK